MRPCKEKFAFLGECLLVSCFLMAALKICFLSHEIVTEICCFLSPTSCGQETRDYYGADMTCLRTCWMIRSVILLSLYNGGKDLNHTLDHEQPNKERIVSNIWKKKLIPKEPFIRHLLQWYHCLLNFYFYLKLSTWLALFYNQFLQSPWNGSETFSSNVSDF